MGTPFTPGQLGKLQTVVNIAVATALPKVAEKYDPKVLLKALDGRGKIFAGHLEVALEQVLDNMLILAPRGARTVTLAERHDPDVFYRTCSGLHVWDDFRSRIVAKARPSEVGATFKIESFELRQDLTDAEIEAALPKRHLFDETQVCAIIAGLIAKQPNGEEGPLINNGYASLFYMSSYVAHVRWRRAGSRRWSVHAWLCGGDGWNAGNQVFFPAN